MIIDVALNVLEGFTWERVARVLNSNFTAALAGALAGALVAQRIGDRAKQRDALLQEIRSTNAAITVAFNICNFGLSTKRQFVRDIYEAYNSQKSALEEFQRRRAAGEQAKDLPFELKADLRALQTPIVPTDILRRQVYDNISAGGRALSLVSAIVGTTASLEEVIKRRNLHIEGFKKLGPDGVHQIIPLYLGLPYGAGHVSTEFSDSIEALYSLTDDLIFFSDLLTKDLMEHGNRILSQYRKISRVKSEKISSVDMAEAHELGLMPDAAKYADWLKGFLSASEQGSPSKRRRIPRLLFDRLSMRREG